MNDLQNNRTLVIMPDSTSKTIVFFRADLTFMSPDFEHFPFSPGEIELVTVEVGDTLEAIDSKLPYVRHLIGLIDADEVWLCAAVSLGFVYILATEVLPQFPEKKFHFLQMARNIITKSKGYEIWR